MLCDSRLHGRDKSLSICDEQTEGESGQLHELEARVAQLEEEIARPHRESEENRRLQEEVSEEASRTQQESETLISEVRKRNKERVGDFCEHGK